MAEGRRERKIYSPEQKVIIVRELLENNVPISQLAEKYQYIPMISTTGRKSSSREQRTCSEVHRSTRSKRQQNKKG